VDDHRVPAARQGIGNAIHELLLGFVRSVMSPGQYHDAIAFLQDGIGLLVGFQASRRAASPQHRAGSKYQHQHP
jgi:hypothetical protein